MNVVWLRKHGVAPFYRQELATGILVGRVFDSEVKGSGSKRQRPQPKPEASLSKTPDPYLLLSDMYLNPSLVILNYDVCQMSE